MKMQQLRLLMHRVGEWHVVVRQRGKLQDCFCLSSCKIATVCLFPLASD